MDRIDENLHRARLWRFLAEAFSDPRATPMHMAGELPDAARALGLDAAPVLDALAAAGDRAGAHDRLFGHTVRGKCPAYEGEYGGPKGLRYAHILGDLQGSYRAFGLKLSGRAHERPDHIAVECEFLAFLALKEACAAELHGADKAELCGDASRRFLEQHLGRFARAFAARVRRNGKEPFYRAAAELLDQAILRDADRLEVEVGPENLPLRDDAGSPDEACIQCAAREDTPR